MKEAHGIKRSKKNVVNRRGARLKSLGPRHDKRSKFKPEALVSFCVSEKEAGQNISPVAQERAKIKQQINCELRRSRGKHVNQINLLPWPFPLT
jgi:hypothetical protein